MRIEPVKVEVILPEKLFDGKDFHDNCEAMNRDYLVTEPEVRDKGIRGFFRRLVQKVTRFLFKGYFERQNAFNADTVRTMNQVLRFISDNDGAADRAYQAASKEAKETIEQVREQECRRYDTILADEKERTTEIFDHTDAYTERMMTRILVLEKEIEDLKKKLEEKGS